MSVFRPYLNLLSDTTGRRFALPILTVMLVFAAIAEALGIGVVLPFIELIRNPSSSTALFLQRFGIFGRTSQVAGGGAFLVAAFLLKNAYVSWSNSVLMRFVYQRFRAVILNVLRSDLAKSISVRAEENTAELVRRLISDTTVVFSAPIPSLFVLMVEAFTSIAIGIGLIWLEPVAVPLAIVLVGGLGFVLQKQLLRANITLGQDARAASQGMTHWAMSALGSPRETRVAAAEPYFLRRFEKASASYAQSMIRYKFVALAPRHVLESLGLVGLVAVCVVVSLRSTDVERLIPLLSVLAVAVVRVLPSIARITAALADVRYYSPAAAELASQLSDAAPPGPRAPTSRLSMTRAIDLQRVRFRYPSSATDVLRELSVEIPKGKVVAFVGPSGAGKSTLLDLLIGLLSPTEGALTVDGASIDAANVASWQAVVGYIPQQPFLVDDTIRRNVAFAVEDDAIDEARVTRALADAHLLDFVRTLPDGLDTLVGEAGARISGGQKQRLGIARALYKDPAVLILDEATASLDALVERQVVATISAQRGTRTVIVVAHRLSTVRDADCIHVLENGVVSASGTFDELTEKSDLFRRMAENEPKNSD